jgi:hypothetical protein
MWLCPSTCDKHDIMTKSGSCTAAAWDRHINASNLPSGLCASKVNLAANKSLDTCLYTCCLLCARLHPPLPTTQMLTNVYSPLVYPPPPAPKMS